MLSLLLRPKAGLGSLLSELRNHLCQPRPSPSGSGTFPIHRICRPCTSLANQPVLRMNNSNSNCKIPGHSANLTTNIAAVFFAVEQLGPSESSAAKGRDGCS